MFSRIVVPLDGSPRAERSLPVAARVARAAEATVVLVRAVDVAAAYGAYYRAPAEAVQVVAEAMHEEAERYLAEVSRVDTLAGVRTGAHVLSGQAGLGILRAIDTHQADLVVLCSHGRTGLPRWALGSVAEHVARHAGVPVLVLREHGPTLAGPHPDPEHLLRVLVPLDGSRLAEAALAPAAQLIAALAAPGGAGVHLALVVSPYEADTRNMPDALMVEGAKGYLARVAGRLRDEQPGVSVSWSVAADLDIAAALIRVAENGEDAEGAGIFGGCDLIAMSTHGASGVARWIMGSVTERVLHAAKLPVLVVRPREMAAP